MTDEKRLTFKLVSLLLQYPGEELWDSIPLVREVLDELPHTQTVEAVEGFLDYLSATPLIRLQEQYTAIFDMDPDGCLNLTYHRCGDDKGRGSAMAELHALYRSAGFEPLTSELPDYLPLILEFLALCPEEAAPAICAQYGSEIERLGSRLKAFRSPYGALFDVALSAIAR